MRINDRLLWILVVIALVGVFVFSAGVFSGMEAHLRSAGGTGGVVALELALTPAGALKLMAAWPADGIAVAQRALWLDFVYIALYASGLAAACTLIARHGAGGWARWGRRLIPLPLLAGALDVIENINLLIVLNRAATAGSAATLSPFTYLAAVCAAIKFALVAVTLLFLLAYAIGWVWRRLRRTS